MSRMNPRSSVTLGLHSRFGLALPLVSTTLSTRLWPSLFVGLLLLVLLLGYTCTAGVKKYRTLGLITLLVLSSVETPNIRAEINEWTSLPWLEGGAVQRLLIDPQNPNTLYAIGSAYGVNLGTGIFKSSNGGANWRAINFGLTNTAVSSLAIVPQNPNVLYAGTWNGSIIQTYAWNGGVFKSIDGGESWGTTGLKNMSVSAITTDPQNPRTVYAATAVGLYKTTDGGITWTRLSPAYLPQVQWWQSIPEDPASFMRATVVAAMVGYTKASMAACTGPMCRK